MELKSISIYRNYDGTVQGTISISGEASDVMLKLNDEQSDRIVAVVAETLVETAKELSQALLAQTITYKDSKLLK